MGWTPTGSGADADAIHDNVASEISAITEKVSPVNADLVIIEDSAAANVKKRVQVGNLPGGGGGLVSARMTGSSQNINNNSTTTVTYDTEDFDTDGSLVDLANNRLNIQTNGEYLITATGDWVANSSGIRAMRIFITSVLVGGVTVTPSASHRSEFTFTIGPLQLTNTDIVELKVFQNSGGTRALSGANTPNALGVSQVA